MGLFASDEDEDNAYRTSEGMVGRSIRRGTDKALKALTLGLLGGTNPLKELADDAVGELVTKTIPRSNEDGD